MSTTITGKLNKAARTFQAGESTGFGIRLGVKYRDPKTKEDAWCNYQAVIFAKAPGQIQFYQNALVEGAVVEVFAEQLKIDNFQGDNGPILTIDMLNARLGYVYSPNSQPNQQQAAPQQNFQQAQQGFAQQQTQQQQRPMTQAIQQNVQQNQQGGFQQQGGGYQTQGK